MNKIFHALCAAAGLLVAGGVQAADAKAAEALLKKHACLACHNTDKKGVGPAYKDVAAKYRGQKDAEAKLIMKVQKGGTGVWGQIPMPPPQPPVADADAKLLVQWILQLK